MTPRKGDDRRTVGRAAIIVATWAHVFAVVVMLGAMACGARSELEVSPGRGGASASSSSAGGAPECVTDADCNCTGNCCHGRCINTANDVLNCGACDRPCPEPRPFCDEGVCGAPACSPVDGGACAAGSTCCGSACCAPTDVCCWEHEVFADSLVCVPPEGGTCPVGSPCATCLAPDTPIATPSGDRPIASLREGDLVFSVDADARIVVVPIARTRRTQVQRHEVVQILFDSGAVLRVSRLHPTVDGAAVASLAVGGMLGPARIVAAATIPYDEAFTFDVLPASDTGAYFAAGALLGSTLAPRRCTGRPSQ